MAGVSVKTIQRLENGGYSVTMEDNHAAQTILYDLKS